MTAILFSNYSRSFWPNDYAWWCRGPFMDQDQVRRPKWWLHFMSGTPPFDDGPTIGQNKGVNESILNAYYKQLENTVTWQGIIFNLISYFVKHWLFWFDHLVFSQIMIEEKAFDLIKASWSNRRDSDGARDKNDKTEKKNNYFIKDLWENLWCSVHDDERYIYCSY